MLDLFSDFSTGIITNCLHFFFAFINVVHVHIEILELLDRKYPLNQLIMLQCDYIDLHILQILTYWRGHQTFPTVVSLKGRVPKKLQSKSTLSCVIVQIHSLFRHGFIKKPKSKFNQTRK